MGKTDASDACRMFKSLTYHFKDQDTMYAIIPVLCLWYSPCIWNSLGFAVPCMIYIKIIEIVYIP